MKDFSVNTQNKVFKNLDGTLGWSIEDHKTRGGYSELSKVLKRKPQDILEELTKSNLRGKGGAGFPTAVKWSHMPNSTEDKPNYLVCNADEGEPGTCKDRYIMRNDPHVLIEGLIISAFCLGVKTVYIYVRGEYQFEAERLQQAIDQAKEELDYLKNGKLDIFIHRGAGSYICGEETALLESIEGKIGLPRTRPPFPVKMGLYGYPTIINNVETLSQVGAIITRGVNWWKSLGSPNHNGTKIFTISGDVNNPQNIELQMGIPLKELIEKHCGGVKGGWNNLQAIIPGGTSSGILTPSEAEQANMSFESLSQFNTSMGTGGVIVISKDSDLKEILLRIMEFYRKESCGQCPPCREGIAWLCDEIKHSLEKEDLGMADLERITTISNKIKGKTICAFTDGALQPVNSFVDKLRDFV
ncbi:MAG: NADH-quinone oxidoreductase subunit NuoF [Proteobacteria bacterium]|nr:NADH-quinone oxidoreductase subunit NuoF [Pseudomonadota bacterium]